MLFCCLKKSINSQIIDVNHFDQLFWKQGFFVLSSGGFLRQFESNKVYFEQHGAGINARLLIISYFIHNTRRQHRSDRNYASPSHVHAAR